MPRRILPSSTPWPRWRHCVVLLAVLVTAPAAARIDIAIPNVTPAVEANVRAFLSLTRYADRKDVTPEIMSRLQRRIVTETREALEPLGYYEPEVAYEVKQDADAWHVTINVQPGRPIRLSEVHVDAVGPGAQQRTLRELIDARDLKPGRRLHHGTYEQVKDALLRTARNEGYLDAQLTKHDLVIDRQERRATVDVVLDTGERYSYGPIVVEQDVIDEAAMRRLLRMRSGEPYTLDSLLRTQYVLDDSQYFASVEIESGTPDRERRVVPITVRADENRRHRYATSLGYGTDTEVRGKFTWDNRRVNRLGHRSKVEILGSSVIKELTGRYIIPVMDVALEKLEFTATLNEEELADTLSERREIGTGLTQVQGRWQRVLFLRLSNETTTEGSGPESTQNTAFYIIPGISYATLPSYIVGGRARPYRLYAELRGSPATFGSDASFLQLRAQGERFWELTDTWDLSVRAELGMSKVDDFSVLPASQRFFAGGERSVRGFGLNELSPRDEFGNRIGGENVATASIEFEKQLPRNFGAAVFYDMGNAFNSFSDPDFQYSAGVGVRYHIAVASFGLDIAQPLSQSGNPRLHLYISTQF